MWLFSSHITPDIVSEISIKFSKEKYIFGVDTHIEGMLDIPEWYPISWDMKIWIRYSIFDSYNDSILNWDTIDIADLSDIADVDDNLIENITITGPKKSFSFLIKSPNFYGDIWVPDYSNYFSYIINCITVSIQDIHFSRRIPVRIEYPGFDSLQLKDLDQRENIDEEDLDDLDETAKDNTLWLKVLFDDKVIPEYLYNDMTEITWLQRIGKFVHDSKFLNKIFLFWIFTFIPYYGWSFNFQTFNIFMDAPKQAIDIVYTVFILICIYLHFFCVGAYKKYIEKKSWWMNMLYDSEEDLEEDYHINCFQKNIMSLRELVAENTKNPWFSLNMRGTLKMGLSLYHSHRKHEQIFINKQFAEYKFSSLATLLDHQIELPDWVRDMVSIHDEDWNLYCDIIIFIQYDGLMNQYREINLY